MEPTTESPEAVYRRALEAAVRAFAAARTGRRLLDDPGRLGADAVTAALPLSGARRASQRAQTSLEEAAQRLEQARERWGALMRGLAADLELPPEELVALVEAAALEGALVDASQALAAAAEAAESLPHPDSELQVLIQQAGALLRRGGSREPGAPPSGQD